MPAKKKRYLGAIPKEDSIWGEVAKAISAQEVLDLDGAWSPWYTVHKIMAGLLDAYLYCNNPKALTIEKGMADWTANTVKKPQRHIDAKNADVRIWRNERRLGQHLCTDRGLRDTLIYL